MKSSSANNTLKFLVALYLVLLYGRFIGSLFFGDTGWFFALLNTFALYLYCPLIVLIAVAIFFRVRVLFIAIGAGLLLFMAQYGSLFVPERDAVAVGANLRVMSFNIPFPVFGNDDERLARAILEQHADVVLMQEMTETGMHALERRLANAYPYSAADRSNLPSEGKLILSKFPLSNSRVIKTGTPVAMPSPQTSRGKRNGLSLWMSTSLQLPVFPIGRKPLKSSKSPISGANRKCSQSCMRSLVKLLL